MNDSEYLTASEAAGQLGITTATLYAYVSRGLIRSESSGSGRRDRRYRGEDVRRLLQRREGRRDPSTAVKGALDWGMPVLESAISLITGGRLYYRGYDVEELASSRRFEDVAALIWETEPAFLQTSGPIPMPSGWKRLAAGSGRPGGIELFQFLLPQAAAADPTSFDLRPNGVRGTGLRILRILTAIASDSQSIEGGIAPTLAAGWGAGHRQASRLIDAALILAADHELNVSAFTVRCVASAGATPYAAINAGLSALGGIRHGGYTERVVAMLREVARESGPHAALSARLRRGEDLPGFGHALYPAGDPRGRVLFQMVSDAFPRSATVRQMTGVRDAVAELTGEGPTIDFGLVALARALELPAGSPLTLFALGRTVGWIGHAIEQYSLDRIIRPRALYTGRQPGMVDSQSGRMG
jgi:citrate synthase